MRDTNQGKRILIVEDEEIVRKILEMQVSSFGYRPHAAGLPGEGLSWFKENYNEIDLVLLDMNMPEMDGLEVFRKMKEIDPKVKVLVLSGYSQHGKIEAALREGVIDYMTKPVRKAILAGKIDEVLSISDFGESGKADSDVFASYDSEPDLNIEFLEGQFETIPGLKNKVIESFLSSAPVLCDNLEKAVQAGDFKEISRSSHKCYGPIVSLGGARAGVYVKAIELAADEDDSAKVELLMSGFRRAFSDLIHELKNAGNK